MSFNDDEQEIKNLADKYQYNLENARIINEINKISAVEIAVKLVNKKEAHILII